MRAAPCPQQLAIVIADIAKLNTTQLRRLHDSIGTLPDPVSAMQVVTQSPLPVLTQSHSWSTVPTRTLPWSLVQDWALKIVTPNSNHKKGPILVWC